MTDTPSRPYREYITRANSFVYTVKEGHVVDFIVRGGAETGQQHVRLLKDGSSILCSNIINNPFLRCGIANGMCICVQSHFSIRGGILSMRVDEFRHVVQALAIVLPELPQAVLPPTWATNKHDNIATSEISYLYSSPLVHRWIDDATWIALDKHHIGDCVYMPYISAHWDEVRDLLKDASISIQCGDTECIRDIGMLCERPIRWVGSQQSRSLYAKENSRFMRFLRIRSFMFVVRPKGSHALHVNRRYDKTTAKSPYSIYFDKETCMFTTPKLLGMIRSVIEDISRFSFVATPPASGNVDTIMRVNIYGHREKTCDTCLLADGHLFGLLDWIHVMQITRPYRRVLILNGPEFTKERTAFRHCLYMYIMWQSNGAPAIKKEHARIFNRVVDSLSQ
jgi:hypothetical protein